MSPLSEHCDHQVALCGRTPSAVRAASVFFVSMSCGAFAQAVIAQPTPDAPSLEPVVVTATRMAQPLSSVLADVSVVERAEIERSGSFDVADLLGRLPGIEFARNGGPGTATTVFLRGNETRHTAVYIDGMRVDTQSTGGAGWEQIPLDQIDRIEVLRGPAGAIYGSDAVAGVVQLFTRRGQGPARPDASVTFASHDTRQARAGVGGSSGAVDYSVSASHGRSDGFNSRTDLDANPDKDGWRRNAVRARLGVQLDPRHRIDATLLESRLRSQFDGFMPGVDDVSRNTLRTGSLAWEGRWTDDAVTRLQIGQTRSTYEQQPDFYRSETRLHNYVLQHAQTVGANVFSATLERREDELFNPETLYAPALQGKRHQNAIGLGWRADFGAHGLQAHVRHDDDSEFGSENTGSLAWGWQFLPQWRFSASAASSFRAPTLYQRFSQYGVATLEPESGRNFEVGLRWTPKEGSQLNLIAWRNKLTNLINFGPPGECRDGMGCFANVGRARIEGVTLAGSTRLGSVLLRGSLSWHDPRNLETDTLLVRRARKLASLGAETKLAGWDVGAEVQAAGARFEDVANTQRMSGYGLMNLFASTSLSRGLVLEGRIDNVSDKQYEIARGYATPGRVVQLSLRWTMP